MDGGGAIHPSRLAGSTCAVLTWPPLAVHMTGRRPVAPTGARSAPDGWVAPVISPGPSGALYGPGWPCHGCKRAAGVGSGGAGEIHELALQGAGLGIGQRRARALPVPPLLAVLTPRLCPRLRRRDRKRGQ